MRDEHQTTTVTDLTVMLRVGMEEHPAQVADISFYSVTLRSPLIVPVGSFLPLRFRLPTGDEVSLHGIVTQVRPRLRVRFEGLSARQFDELAALVADVRRRGGDGTQPLIDQESVKRSSGAEAADDDVDVRAQLKALSAEVARLRDQVSSHASLLPQPKTAATSWTSASSASSLSSRAPPLVAPATPTVVALLTAIDPMLWGLEEAVKFFSASSGRPSPQHELHLRHLHLLQKLLVRLNDEILDVDR